MINVDISNIWGEISLPELLAVEAAVAAAHASLTEGTGEDGEAVGWLTLPEQGSGEIRRIEEAADQIRSESDVLIVLGAGGACTGARGAIELLQGSDRNIGRGKGDPQIFFAGNSLSTRQWNELTKLLEGKDFSLCVIGGTMEAVEPAIALRSLKWNLERKYGTDEAKKRIYAVTDSVESALGQMAEAEGWDTFLIPEAVEADFSVLTAAGLLSMAAAGIDIGALLQGVREARLEYDLRSFENPAWLYTAVRYLLHGRGKDIELLESFEPGFDWLGRWWRQLFSGSEGKHGKGLFPAAARLPMDLYSLGQMVRDGKKNLFETVLRFDPPENAVCIGEDVRNLDGLNYLAGKTLAEVEDAAFAAMVDAHTDSGVSVISMECSQLDAEKVGELFWFFMLSCGISACMLGVEPFSRPAAAAFSEELQHRLGRPEPADPKIPQ